MGETRLLGVRSALLIAFLFVVSLPENAKAQGGPSSRSISVLSQNIWGLPAILVKNKKARLKAFCQMLQSRIDQNTAWDVVILQELWMKKDQTALSNCGYPYFRKGQNKNLDSGLMILSKYPIVSSFRMKYNVRHEPGVLDAEVFAHKSAFFALVDHPNAGKVWVVNTHLAAADQIGHSNVTVRSAQLEQLAERIHDLPAEDAVIFGGDLNTGPGRAHDASWDTFLANFPFLRQVDYSPEVCTYCAPNRYVKHNSGKIDHIFADSHFTPVSGGVALQETFKVSKKKTGNYSDHFGWESTFNRN